MPLVINSLRGGHAHTYTRHAQNQLLEIRRMPGLKIFHCIHVAISSVSFLHKVIVHKLFSFHFQAKDSDTHV